MPILEQAHIGIVRGQLSIEIMAKAILTLTIWWKTLLQDTIEYVKTCDKCQRFEKPMRSNNMSMRPLMRARAFTKWGMDFVGPKNPLAYRT